MGEHDQTVDKDSHRSIHDDGRILRPVREDEYLLEYDEAGYPSGKRDLPSYAREAFLFRGEELIPETVYVHGENFTATEWEAEYSNVIGSGDEQTFTPVINDSYRVVGHFGWIGGHNICVPRKTIADYSPSAVDFQQARLREWQRQRVWSYNHPLPRLPGQSVSAAPTKRPDICWPANKPPATTLMKPEDEKALWKSLLEATPGQDPSEELRIRENMNFFLAGGGTAIVGRRFGYELKPPGWQVNPHDTIPYDTYLTLPYRCLVLVGPDGYIQEMLRVEWAPPESRNEKILRVALEVIDLALTIWMIIDIVTIPIALFRLTGELVAREALVQAVRLHENLEVKAVFEGAAREAAAKASGNAAMELRGVTSELKPAMEEEFGAGAGRRVSAIDRGRGARPFYGTSRNRLAAASPNMNIARETAGTGGIRAVSGVRAADGSKKIVVEGSVRKSIARRGFEKNLVSGSDLGLPTYERLHLWGPRLGDEAAAGIWLGPGKINIGEQARVEKLLQDLATKAEGTGGTVRLSVTGATYPPGDLPINLRAHEFLSEITYEFSLEGPGIKPFSGRITISIGPPPHGSVQTLGADVLDAMLKAH